MNQDERGRIWVQVYDAAKRKMVLKTVPEGFSDYPNYRGTKDYPFGKEGLRWRDVAQMMIDANIQEAALKAADSEQNA